MAYHAMCKYLDDNVDALVRAWKAKPSMWDNTLMVVNGRTNAPIEGVVPVGDPRIQHIGPTVVEGNLVVGGGGAARLQATGRR